MTLYDVYRVSKDGAGVCVMQGLHMKENAEAVARAWGAHDAHEAERKGVVSDVVYEVVERTVGDAA